MIPAILGFISLLPWLLFGLAGPFSDATFHLETAAGKYALIHLDFVHLLYTCGPPLFLAPILFLVHNHWFFWIGSLVMAATSVLAGCFFWRMLKRFLYSPWAAFAGAALMSFHPFLHQLQFYWMTEFAYAATLLAGLYYLARALEEQSNRLLVLGSAWLFLSRLMRPQADIGFLVGAAGILLFGLWPRQERNQTSVAERLRRLCLWLLVPLALSVPFRVLNHYQHDTWLLTKSLGNADGFYLQMDKGSYNEANGPASKQLWDWCMDLRSNPDPKRFPQTGESVVQEGLRECMSITGDHYMDYGAPREIYFLYTNDWQRADEFVSIVKREAIKSDPKRYLRWAIRHFRWYISGPSENRTEWQDRFPGAVLSRRSRPFVFPSRLGITQTKYLGGIATDHPTIFQVYNASRTVFWKSVTRGKKWTALSFPFLLWIVYKRYSRSAFYFLSMAYGTHITTALALASMTGFHHRYAVPLELFTLIYLAFWLDILLMQFIHASRAPERHR